MSRQYKTMQSDLIAKVNVLQREGLDAKTRLGSLQISHADQMSEQAMSGY
jgi:hypothetical protein